MISPIKSYSYSPVYTNFTATPETSKTTDVAVEELEKGNQKKFKFKKFSEMSDKDKKVLLVSTATLAGMVGIVIGRGRKSIRENWLSERLSRATSDFCSASEELTRVKAELDGLKAVFDSATGSEKALRKTTAELREMFTDLVESDLSPKEIREQIFTRMKALIDENSLNYDVMSPPITGKGITEFADALELPVVGTGNRANMQPLNIPLLSRNGEFSFTLPEGAKRASHMESRPFTPVYNQPTTISIGYADSVN